MCHNQKWLFLWSYRTMFPHDTEVKGMFSQSEFGLSVAGLKPKNLWKPDALFSQLESIKKTFLLYFI